MGKFQDLTGQKFNKLTVLRRAENSAKGSARWICRCECGNITCVDTYRLKNGKVISCGCYRTERTIEANFKDLTGQRFGRLTVVKQVDKSKFGQTRWLCRCDCGNFTEASTINLRNGNVQSCGCLSMEVKTSFEDLSGKVFGRLTVIKLHHSTPKVIKGITTGGFYHYYLCRCECGNEVIKRGDDLRQGRTKSCGCLRREIDDLTGQRFGKLLVIKPAESKIDSKGRKKTTYLCKCDCGGEIITTRSALKNGNTISCGCVNSYGEVKIKDILEKNKVLFKRQKYYPDLKDIRYLKFDFHITDNNYLIEFDGVQHFVSNDYSWNTEEHLKTTQKHDQMKNEYCIKNKIPLIRIPYTHLKDLCIEDLRLETSKFIINEDAVNVL